MKFQFVIFDQPGGTMLADWSSRVQNVASASNEHGFEGLTATIPLHLVRAFRYYEQPGAFHVCIYNGGRVVWEGRMEQPSITADSVRGDSLEITAYGYSRAYKDVPYTALWSDTRYSSWTVPTAVSSADTYAQRYELDNQNRLYFAPRKNEQFGIGATTIIAYQLFAIPSQSVRQITSISYTYELTPGTNWQARLYRLDNSNTILSVPWSLTSSGGAQTGTQALTLTACDRVAFALYNTGAVATYTGETGDVFLRITSIRVKTTTSSTVDASEIAKALLARMNAINPSQVAAYTSGIQSQGLDLTDIIYEDAYPADILDDLIARGDNQSPPRRWYWRVFEDRKLEVLPQSSAGQTWYVIAASLKVVRSLDDVRNSVYAVYQDASGTTVRGAASTDNLSINRYGMTRNAAVNVNTTSASQATIQRDATVTDQKNPFPSAAITFDAIYYTTGVRGAFDQLRAGDVIHLRNLVVNSVEIDRLTTMRLSRVSWDHDTNSVQVEPETPLPLVDVLLAQQK
jgi:hypothetical protein